MAGSKFSLPPVNRAGGDPEARNRQLLAVESDIQAGRLSEAATMLNELARADPNDSRVYVGGWLLANKAGNVDAALQSAQRVVELAPMSPLGYFCLSETERARGNVTAASTSINQALMLAPTNLQFREFAVNLATAQGNHAATESHLRAAFAQNGDIPGIRTLIGNALRSQSKFAEAETWLTQAVEADGNDADAQHGLAMLAYLRDDRVAARQHIAYALQVRPADVGYLYLDAVFRGEAPAHPPEAMAQSLIDRDASRFDANPDAVHKHRVAATVAAAIRERFPERKLNILDLGCGSGALGVALGRIDGFFVGVDLSMPMLEEAKKHDVYARLHHVNLLDALAATDANEYEVIVAVDVFIHLGALDAAIAGAHKVLRPGGWLFFSCADAPDDGANFVVRKSMHYAQSQRYVKRLLNASGFAAPLVEPIDLYDLADEPDAVTPGFLVSVQKSA